MLSQLNGNGRVWIYVCNRKLNRDESDFVEKSLRTFASQWKAHGASLLAEFEILHSQIIVLGVDENFEQASGCSIDTSIQVFREIESALHADLFNRLNIPFLIQDQIILIPLAELNSAYDAGTIDAHTPVYDTSISDLDGLRSRFKTSIEHSWLSRKIKSIA
jgi:hypothetical protein